jgi:very-short-patch-repair endonuclease
LRRTQNFPSPGGRGKRGGGKEGMSTRLASLAKNLRKNQTDVEKLLWQKLKARQIEGVKFRRQQPIGDFIVDFASFEKRLIIELDGGQHTAMREADT